MGRRSTHIFVIVALIQVAHLEDIVLEATRQRLPGTRGGKLGFERSTNDCATAVPRSRPECRLCRSMTRAPSPADFPPSNFCKSFVLALLRTQGANSTGVLAYLHCTIAGVLALKAHPARVCSRYRFRSNPRVRCPNHTAISLRGQTLARW